MNKNIYLYTSCLLQCIFSNGKEEKVNNGTGFFVLNSNGHTFLITNRHMVNPSLSFESYDLIKIRIHTKVYGMDYTKPMKNEVLEMIISDQIVYPEIKENDVCAIKMKNYTVLHNTPLGMAFGRFLSHNIIATKEEIDNKLSIFDEVTFIGFPGYSDLYNDTGIARGGKIASDPRLNYSNTSEFKGECIAYEAFSTGGASGSPVYLVNNTHTFNSTTGKIDKEERIRLIGINAGHFQDYLGHTGISYFYKSSIILELINQPFT